MLKIGLSPAFMPPDDSRAVFGKKTLTYMESDMARFVFDMGAVPILIPDLNKEELKNLMKELDGLVLQGGSDISPLNYAEEGIENNRWPGDSYRDKVELLILEVAFELKLPIFGICRGFQLINVFQKGKLYQDLSTQISPETLHRSAEEYDKIHHEVLVQKNSLLEDLYKKKNLKVNTVHHQGVKVLGENLLREAICPEHKIIEAFKLDSSNHFVYGVQWHPEFFHTLGSTLDSHQPLTNFFINKVKEYHNENH